MSCLYATGPRSFVGALSDGVDSVFYGIARRCQRITQVSE